MPVAHHELAVLEHERRGAEHGGAVGCLRIHGNVGQRARTEMSAILEPEQPRRRATRHRRDFGQRIFAPDRRQRGHLQGLRRQSCHPFGAQVAVHQQGEQIRIGRERRAVGMVRREEHARRIADQQEQLEADRPLDRVVEIAGPVVVRHDPAAVRVAVDDHPLARTRLAARVELTQQVRGDRHRLPKHDLADVDGQLLGAVHRLGDACSGRRESPRTLPAVSVELQVRQMQRQPLRGRDGGARSVGVSRQAEVVAVHVQRMRHAEVVDRALQRLDDRPRGDAVERHDVV